MAGTLSGSITFQGLGSGTDFSSIISALKKIESIPMQRMEVWKAEWQTRIDGFNEIITTMEEARSTLRDFQSLSKIMAKTVSSSKDTVATATADASLDEGVYTIDVRELATASIFSNKKVFDGKDAKVNDTGAAQTFSYTYHGTTRTLTVPSGSTLQQFVDQINKDPHNPGVKASMIKNGSGYIFQIQGKQTGKENSLAISSSMEAFDASPRFPVGADYDQITLNDTGEDQNYTYYYRGKAHSVTITDGMTVQGFLDAINAETASTGISARIDDATGRLVMTSTRDIALSPIPEGSGTKTTTVTFTSPTETEFVEETEKDADGNVIRNPDGTEKKKTIERNKSYTFTLPAGATAQDYVDKFNSTVSKGEIKAVLGDDGIVSYTDKDGNPLTANAPVDTDPPTLNAAGNFTISGNSPDIAKMRGEDSFFPPSYTGMDVQLSATSDNSTLMGADGGWHAKQATDARFTLNGWPQELSSSSNTLTEVVEGLTITLKDTGVTNLGVTNDTDKLKENIRTVVDAINTMRAKITELTKVDDDKEVKSPEVNENTGLLALQSQFTWQKGASLTGNYGVQLLSSRLRDLTATGADGFVGRTDEDDMINDLFTSWSQIGISTVTDESDPEFGLLRIDEDKLNAAISKDIRNVAELFASAREGSTDSTNFSVASAGTRAKAGVYGVSYETDASGQITQVWINGSKASSDSAYPGRWTVGDMDNAAAGLAIQFPSDLVLEPNRTYTGDTVRLKEGKINEMLDLLNAELQPVVMGNKEKAGSLPLLIDNYKGVISNIDDKIDRETTRLALWETRQKAKYSRLETLLSQYNSKMESASAALAQLGTSSSKS